MATTRAKYPKAPAPGTIAEPPVFLGGKKPGDARTLAAIKAQGKLHEAATIGPAADKYKTAFVTWSDGQFATRVQETGATVTMNDVRKAFPDLAKELSKMLDQIVVTQGTPQQSGAIEEYSKLAVAGVQALAQAGKNKESVSSQQQNVATANAGGNVKQSLRDAGVDPTRLSQFGEIAKQSGSPMTTARTNDPTANALLKLAGYTLT